jgi:NAD(P)-dependent dehydrogenase (short-subunit alcohol dehydrogenase family)
MTQQRGVVVTGGSGGIGRAILTAFLEAGDRVVNLDRDPPPLSHPSLTHIPVRLEDPEAIVAAFDGVDVAFGDRPLSILVSCAGMSRAQHLFDVTAADFDLLMAVNVRAMLLCGQQAARRMKRRGGGHIVNIGSIAGAQAWALEPVYSVTKAAVAGLTQAMAVDFAPFGVAVNSVGPGPVEAQSLAMAKTRDREDIYQHELDRMPLRRFADPTEIAQAVLFLSGARFITGQTLYVDGGFLASGLTYFGDARADLLERLKADGG